MELTERELGRATLLRALEWGNMPLFASQVFVPASFLFFTWWHVVLTLVLFNWMWHPFKYVVANYRIATYFCYLNSAIIRWPMVIGFGIYYTARGSFLIAALSIFWPLIVLLLILLSPMTKNGVLQQIFMEQIVQRN